MSRPEAISTFSTRPSYRAPRPSLRMWKLPELALLPPLSFLLSTVSILQLIGLMTPGRMDEQNLKFPFELGQKQIWAVISVLSGDSDYANLNQELFFH